MKPIINISIKLIVLFALTGLCCLFMYSKRNPGKEYYAKDVNFDILNLGNSHGSAFHYRVFGVNGKNAYANGNSAYYFNELYKFYKGNLNEGAIIVIPLSYFSFGMESGLEKDSPFNNKFYHFLPPRSIRNYKLSKHADLVNDVIIENFKIIVKGETFKNENILIKSVTSVSFKPYGYTKFTSLPPNKDKNRDKESQRISLAQKRAFNADNIENNIKYLSKLINDALENDFKPVLVTTPYTVYYNNNFEKEWLDKYFYQNVSILTKKYNIPYFDYSKQTKLIKGSYFNDCHHLNVFGKTSTTKLLLKDLKKHGLLSNRIKLPRQLKGLNNVNIDGKLQLEYAEILELEKEKTFVFLFFNKELSKHFKNKDIQITFINGDKTTTKTIKDGDNAVFVRFKKLQNNVSFYFTNDPEKKRIKIL